MRAASVNLNKRFESAEARARFTRWCHAQAIDLVMAQEPSLHTPSATLAGYSPVGGNEKTFSWCREDWQVGPAQILSDYYQRLEAGYLAVYNCYLDAYARDRRIAQLEELHEIVERETDRPTLVVGDFNLAPAPEDGMLEDRISTFTSGRERDALDRLCRSARLVDLGALGPRRFTLERARPRQTRFRCDLALISDYVADEVRFTVDGSVNRPPDAFTDHAALLLDLPVSLPVRRDRLQTLFPLFEPQSAEDHSYRPENTAISRRSPSTVANTVVTSLVTPFCISSIFDYGCGRGADVQFYRERGLHAEGYDPNEPFGWSSLPQGLFDLVTITFVINVVSDPWQRLQVLRAASTYCAPDGMLLVTARSPSEIGREAIKKRWPAFNDGFWSDKRRGMFQRGIPASEFDRLAHRLGWTRHPMDAELSFGEGVSHALLQRAGDSSQTRSIGTSDPVG